MCLECMCGSVDRVSGRGGAYVLCVCEYRVSECVDVHVFNGVYSNAERSEVCCAPSLTQPYYAWLHCVTY